MLPLPSTSFPLLHLCHLYIIPQVSGWTTYLSSSWCELSLSEGSLAESVSEGLCSLYLVPPSLSNICVIYPLFFSYSVKGRVTYQAAGVSRHCRSDSRRWRSLWASEGRCCPRPPPPPTSASAPRRTRANSSSELRLPAWKHDKQRLSFL